MAESDETTTATPPTATPAATATAAAASTVAAATPSTVAARTSRKVREGVVVSEKMDKTCVVAVIERVRHPKYAKFVQRTKRLYVHDDANDAHVGDKVRVTETRPLSKLKRWRLVEVLERAK